MGDVFISSSYPDWMSTLPLFIIPVGSLSKTLASASLSEKALTRAHRHGTLPWSSVCWIAYRIEWILLFSYNFMKPIKYISCRKCPMWICPCACPYIHVQCVSNEHGCPGEYCPEKTVLNRYWHFVLSWLKNVSVDLIM